MSPSPDSSLRVVICCDTDPDRADFGGIRFDEGSRPQIWRGVDCIAETRDRLDAIRDSRGAPVRVTWMLRCDEQIRVTERSYEALLVGRAELWRRCRASGDEIGWHPHFWRLAPDGRVWFHEVTDTEFQIRMLVDSHDAFTRAHGVGPASVRMGWDFHNSQSMATLADLGVRIDLSALPYQAFAGSRNDRGASFAGCFDWSTVGDRPYRPARSDYRVACSGDDCLDIIELPQSILHSRLVGLLAEARGALRERSIARLVRAARGGIDHVSTVKACAPPPLFRAMLRAVLGRRGEWLVTYFHPDELLERKDRLVNDLIHRRGYFLSNASMIVTEAARVGRPVEFLTASQAADILAR